MNIIFKQFTTRYVKFNSNLDAETLNIEMRKFCARSFWNFNDNLTGRVRSDGRYSFSPKWEIGVSGISVMPKLRAKVIPQGDESLVEVSMPVPFASAIIAIILFVVGFFVTIVYAFGTPFKGGEFVLGLMMMFMFPSGIAYQNNWRRAKLLSKFADKFWLYQK